MACRFVRLLQKIPNSATTDPTIAVMNGSHRGSQSVWFVISTGSG